MASVILAGTTTGSALSLTSDTSGELQLQTNNGATTAMTLTTGGNINIPTLGARITGDFSNATASSRVLFQSSTTNGVTSVAAIPNGSSTSAFVGAYNSSAGNDCPATIIRATSTENSLLAAGVGTFSYLPMTFYTGGSERLRIDTSGNVGIATSSPSSFGKFAVQGASTNRAFYADSLAQPVARYDDNSFVNAGFTLRNTGVSGSNQGIGILFQLGTGGTPIDSGAIQMRSEADYSTSANQDAAMTFATVLNGTNAERMRIDSSGNVGIGTTSAFGKLNVVQSGDTQVAKFSATSYGLTFNSDAGVGFRIEAADPTGLSSYQPLITNGSIQIYRTGNTERMRIDSSGNLLVGTTSSTAKFTLTGGGQTSYFTQSTSGGYVNSMSAANNSGVFYYMNFLEAATSRGTITSNGSVMTYGGTSDYRLKENIEPMTNGLERISKLKPVTYKWKENGRASEGFIAHELQEVVPDAVTGVKDQVDAKGNPMYQNIDPRMIVATLTAAIQEQQTLIENLTTRLNALEGK